MGLLLKNGRQAGINACLPFFMLFYTYYLIFFSQSWLATVQEVLQADWQEVWHSPQPP